LHSDREKAADAVLTAMCMVALVAGSRPSRAGESFTLNFPNPARALPRPRRRHHRSRPARGFHGSGRSGQPRIAV